MLSLNIKSDVQNNSEHKQDVLLNIPQKNETNNLFGNLKMGGSNPKAPVMERNQPIIKYNNSPDPFDFEQTFPNIQPINKTPPKPIISQNLEASLMNIDDLVISLSKSVGPRTLDSIKL